MAVIAHIILRDLTRERYDAVRVEAGWLEMPPTGGHVHVTWWEGADCHSIDAWESEEAFTTFGAERLGPAMARLGVTSQPEVTFHPAHEVYAPRALTLA